MPPAVALPHAVASVRRAAQQAEGAAAAPGTSNAHMTVRVRAYGTQFLRSASGSQS
jgi:hypothetical protein